MNEEQPEIRLPAVLKLCRDVRTLAAWYGLALILVLASFRVPNVTTGTILLCVGIGLAVVGFCLVLVVGPLVALVRNVRQKIAQERAAQEAEKRAGEPKWAGVWDARTMVAGRSRQDQSG